MNCERSAVFPLICVVSNRQGELFALQIKQDALVWHYYYYYIYFSILLLQSVANHWKAQIIPGDTPWVKCYQSSRFSERTETP